jgi:hypothetical protein
LRPERRTARSFSSIRPSMHRSRFFRNRQGFQRSHLPRTATG